MAPDEQYWRQVLSGERQGVKYALMRAGLGALEGLYAAGLSMYLAAERIGVRSRARVHVPVISVGNLSVGGVGKTPMTQWLARRLLVSGYRPAILSRGHGGSLAPDSAVVSDANGEVFYSAAEAGDEPVLLARTLPGVPVVVGKDRRVSAHLALDLFAPNVLLLDDGFQYWQLARDLDLVLLDARRPFDNGHALPRGFLREPKANLGRAGMVVLTRADGVDEAHLASLRREVKELAPSVSVFEARHKSAGILPVNRIADGVSPGKALLVCGIGQPASFQAAVESEQVDIAGPMLVFPDHQPYGSDEAQAITGRMRETGATCVITTEKDAVKMGESFVDAPLFALRITMRVEDEEIFWETLRLRAGLTGLTHG
ncbi:MAG: tetraacyldisaccharide 4'-kinase [Capsulimonadaceae bacterium]|nr:tetraacyldisaccharide 4'-kinase [Capsulimonadaceae bacterium]